MTAPADLGDLRDLSPGDLAAIDQRAAEIEFAQRWRCDRLTCDGLPHEGREWRHARAAQVPPFLRPVAQQPTFRKRVSNGWQRRWYKRWYARAGRRWGKTWSACRALVEVIATFGGVDAEGHARQWFVCSTKWDYTIANLMESPSGIIEAAGGFDGPLLGSRRDAWNKSKGILTFKSGAVVRVSSAHDGGIHLQGFGYSGGIIDEPGLWNRKTWQTTWEDSILTSTAVDPGYIIIAGTPKKGHPLTLHLIDDESVLKVRGRMEENTSLSAEYRERRRAELAGSQRGLQELDGEQLDDVEGAVFTAAVIEEGRVDRAPVETLDGYESRRVVVDPAGDSGKGDEHGITVWGALTHPDDGARHSYLLADLSLHGTMQQAAQAAVDAAVKYDAQIVLENTGVGQGMPTIIRNINERVIVRTVTAPKGYGKTRRAETALALYETGRAHHVGEYPLLEQQMTTWTEESPGSPDRMDTVAWALIDLHSLETPQQKTGGRAYFFDDD